MIWHKYISTDRHGNNRTLCGRQGAATSIRKAITCNHCRRKMHMKLLSEESKIIMPVSTGRIIIDGNTVHSENLKEVCGGFLVMYCATGWMNLKGRNDNECTDMCFWQGRVG